MNYLDIKNKRKILKYTQVQLAELLGVSKQTIINYEKGEVIPESKSKILNKVLNQTETPKQSQPYISEVKEVGFDEFMEAEYLPVKVQAGYLSGLEQSEPMELKKMLVPKEFEKGFYKVIEIQGDSMDDGTISSIANGDKLLIKQLEDFNIRNKKISFRNDLFIIVSSQGIVCKQITNHDLENRTITCHSFNASHKDYTISIDEIYQLFYVKKIIDRKPKF